MILPMGAWGDYVGAIVNNRMTNAPRARNYFFPPETTLRPFLERANLMAALAAMKKTRLGTVGEEIYLLRCVLRNATESIAAAEF
jgi:hypothetical protein